MYFLERFASFAAAYAAPAHGAEVIEVFGRRTTHVVSTRRGGPLQPPETEQSTQWQILVSSLTNTSSGTAATTDLTEAGLRSTVELARLLRRTVPAPPRRQRSPACLPAEPVLCPPLDPDALDAVHQAVGAPGTVTVTHGTASVWLADSAGRTGCYAIEEAQLALRSPTGALGASVATTLDRLDLAAASADLDREQTVLALPRTTVRTASWLMLTPLATAQLLSHLAAGLVLAGPAAIGERVGSDAVTLVDLPGGVLFDDEGVPARETTIIQSGRLTEPLSDGHARRRDWDSHTQVAPTNLVLRPRGTITHPPGVGLLVTRISGVREAALDLWRTPLRLTLHGATLREGEPAERAHGVVEATAQQILTGVTAVAGPVRNFRVAGLFGGATCLIDGLPSRLV